MGRNSGGGGRGGGSASADSRTPGQRAIDEFGGRTWEKGGQSRVYLGKGEITDELGLQVTYRRSGSIDSATLNGSRISASRAGGLVYGAGSFYVDNHTGQLYSPFNDNDLRETIGRIANRIGASGVVYKR